MYLSCRGCYIGLRMQLAESRAMITCRAEVDRQPSQQALWAWDVCDVSCRGKPNKGLDEQQPEVSRETPSYVV